MLSVFILVVFFFTPGDTDDGGGQYVVHSKAFDSRALCMAQIAPVTASLLKQNINQASVSCQEFAPDDNNFGDLS